MTDLIIASGDILGTTQSVSGDGGKIAIQTDAYIINAAGKGLQLTSTGSNVWNININGGIQSTAGFGLHLISAPGAAPSNLNVGVNGTIFSGGVFGVGDAIISTAPINIKNEGSIAAANGAAISLLGLSSANFKIENTASGIIRGNSIGTAIFVSDGSTGTLTFDNAGKIDGDVELNAGAVMFKNSGSMGDLQTSSGNDKISNTSNISDVLMGNGNNTFNNSGLAGDCGGGNGSDTVANNGRIHNSLLAAGLNSFKNGKLGDVNFIGAQDVIGTISSNTISNAGIVNDINLALTSGTNKISNTNLIDGDVFGGSGADTLSNTKTILGTVNLGQGTNVFTNSGFAHAYIGGTGSDTVTNSGEIGNTVDLGAGNDFYTGSNKGGKIEDRVVDNAGADVIKLGAGDDSYFAFGGADGLTDIIDGGAGKGDFYDASPFVSNLVINLDKVDHVDFFAVLSGTTALGNNAVTGGGNDTITNFENARGGTGSDIIFGNAAENTIRGGDGSDVLYGLAGRDTINGGSQNDKIIGGAGSDRLTGAAGNDQFIFQSLSDSGNTAITRDEITDFTTTVDDMVLTDIDANSLVAGDQSFTFLAGTNADFTGVAGQLRFLQLNNSATGAFTLVQGDVNGDQIADFSIELRGHIALVAGDFVI
jgi:serralysin